MDNGYMISNTVGSATPNWLSSEVGMVLKTYQIAKTNYSADSAGKYIAKSGTVVKVSEAVVGLLFEDVDVTNGDRAGSVLVAGRVYKDRVNAIASIATDETALKALGIYFDATPETTRE